MKFKNNSIGLEKNHGYADVNFFSSCKGLFGPTGLGFIGYKNKVKLIQQLYKHDVNNKTTNI